MLIWGWGTDNRQWATAGGGIIFVTWSYFDLFWFPVAYTVKWYYIDEDHNERRVTYEEVTQLMPVNTPKLGWFKRYGLLVALMTIVIISAVHSLFV